MANLYIDHLLGRLAKNLVVLDHVPRLDLSLSLHVERLENGLLEDGDAGLLEGQNGVAQDRHQFALVLGRPLLVCLLRVDPNVSISAKDSAYGGLMEELMDVALHPANQIVVHLHQHPILQLPILFSSRVQLDFAVESADLLDLSGDEIAFDIVVTNVELIFLDSSTLNTTR